MGIKVEVSDIEETFLVNTDPKYDEDKLKKRGSNNSFTYQRKYRCVKDDDNYSQEIRKPLTSLQYVTLKEQKADMDFETVFRQRMSFVYNNLYKILNIVRTRSTCTIIFWGRSTFTCCGSTRRRVRHWRTFRPSWSRSGT